MSYSLTESRKIKDTFLIHLLWQMDGHTCVYLCTETKYTNNPLCCYFDMIVLPFPITIHTFSPNATLFRLSVCQPWSSFVKRNAYNTGHYKLSEDFAKPYFHKYRTEIHDVTTIWKRNVCSFTVTLNAFDLRPTCDTADVQAILPFPPNPLKHVLYNVPDCGVDALSQFW